MYFATGLDSFSLQKAYQVIHQATSLIHKNLYQDVQGTTRSSVRQIRSRVGSPTIASSHPHTYLSRTVEPVTHKERDEKKTDSDLTTQPSGKSFLETIKNHKKKIIFGSLALAATTLELTRPGSFSQGFSKFTNFFSMGTAAPAGGTTLPKSFPVRPITVRYETTFPPHVAPSLLKALDKVDKGGADPSILNKEILNVCTSNHSEILTKAAFVGQKSWLGDLMGWRYSFRGGGPTGPETHAYI